MVVVTRSTLGFERADPHANPRIQPGEEHADFGDTEIPRIAAKDSIEVLDDGFDVPPLLTSGQLSNLFFEPLDGFGSDAKAQRSKVKPEKLKAL